ncbi:hypothetical protein ACKKBG_A19155 [Auxenochlorella protothecoides x Auxenochlorella symbiontica]
MNSTQFNEELAHALHSIWTPETYRSFYDEAYCLTNNVTLKSRSNAEESFNYCSVPLEDQDSILFLALAVLFTAGLSGKLALTGVLVAGGVLGVVNYYVNLGHLGNAVSIWLGIQPPDLFLYVFLPPLLADAALRIRFSLFRKVALNIGILAYAMVILNVLVLTPFVPACPGLCWAGHGLGPWGSVCRHAGTHRRRLGVGPAESRQWPGAAGAITLYSIFAEVLEEYQNQPLPPATALLGHIVVKILKLTSIGLAIGLAFGYFTGWLMRLLRWRGIPVPLDATVILAIAYLSFYVGQGPAQSSGVIAVAVFGLWGAATSLWGRFALEEEEKVWFAVWDSVSAVANGVVFFWAGVASLNFLVRSSDYLTSPGWVYGSIPIIFLFMFLFRFVTILLFNPLVLKGGTWLNLGQAVFVMAGGLRGALSLILVADLIITSNFHSSAVVASENATIVVWTSAFVLLTLLVNAPLLGPIMTWSGIKKMSAARKQLRLHGLSLLQKFTDNKIAALRTDHSFISQGANWEQVAEMTSHLAAMTSFEKASGGTSTSLPVGDRDSSATVGASGGTESTPAPTLPESGGGSDRSGRFASLQPEQAGLKSDEILLPHDLEAATPGQPQKSGMSRLRKLFSAPDFLQHFHRAGVASAVVPAHHESDPVPAEETVVLLYDSSNPQAPIDAQAWEAAMQTHGSLAKREHGAPARSVAVHQRMPSVPGGSRLVSQPKLFPHLDPSDLNAALGSDEASQRGQLLTGLQRYFQRQRAAGLLSSQGLDVLILACEVAEHHVDLHPGDPLTLWSLVDQDVSGGWGTRAQAVILRKLLVLPQRLPRAGQRCAAFVFLPFTALLQASLSRQMVTACEAALEMSQGLLRELRWAGASDISEEVHSEASAARESLVSRQSEAPSHFHALQSYRTTMAVLRSQREYISQLYQQGIFLEAEEAELGGAVDGAIRRLDATGPSWRVPRPLSMLKALPVFCSASEPQLRRLLDAARLQDHTRTQGAIWSSADSAAAPALHVVASGVVTATIAHAGGWEAEAHQGVGFVYGALDLIMGGATSPWRRSVAPHVNALGQGPQVYTFPAASLAALPPACQDDLLIQAAAEVLEGTEKDLNRDTSTVILWFKGGASLPGPGLPRLQSMVQHEIQMHLSPGESHVLRLEPGAEWAQASHAVLLRGSLVPQAQAEATCVPPAVLPFLPALRPRKDAAPQPQRWRAGPEGAVLVHLG